MPRHDLIVVGASAGGVEALSQLVEGLPADLPACVLVVIHLAEGVTSHMPAILSRRGSLPALHPGEGDPLTPGCIYIAPPGFHMTIRDHSVHLERGPKINGTRPAIDPLFRSAAREGGERVVGVILSGMLDDGAAGLVAIKEAGGLAIVQDPEDALYDSMPRCALESVAADEVLPAIAIGPALARLVKANGETAGAPGMESTEEPNLEPIRRTIMAQEDGQRPNEASIFVCPECNGTLWEMNDHGLVRYQCHLGHGYSLEALSSAVDNQVESALWSAVRVLEDKASLKRRMATLFRQRGTEQVAASLEKQAEQAETEAGIVRKVLLGAPAVALEPGDEPAT